MDQGREVGPGTAFCKPLDVKLALERRFQEPFDVKLALERQFWGLSDVKLALVWVARQAGQARQAWKGC